MGFDLTKRILIGQQCAFPHSTPIQGASEYCVCPDHNVTESLEESAAAYTKATAKKCILEKVEVRTGEEAESNVLQVNRYFRFDAENPVLMFVNVQSMWKCT